MSGHDTTEADLEALRVFLSTEYGEDIKSVSGANQLVIEEPLAIITIGGQMAEAYTYRDADGCLRTQLMPIGVHAIFPAKDLLPDEAAA